MMKKDKNNQNINSIPKYLWGNYFKKPIKWLAHLINNYGSSKHPFITTGTSYAYAIGDEKRRHPELTELQIHEIVNSRIKQNRKKLGLPTDNNTTPSLAAAGLALGSIYYPWLAVPDIVFDVAASIDEPSTSNTIHTIADFPETVAKFTPSKIDDYVAKGVLTLGNIDDAVSTSGRNMFSNFDKKSGKINNTTDKTSVRESTNIRYRKNGGLIRKMLTASGGPIYLLRKRLYRNITPFGYHNPVSRTLGAIILNRQDDTRSKENKRIKDSDPDASALDALWATYLNIPENQRRNINSKYGISKTKDGYYRFNNPGMIFNFEQDLSPHGLFGLPGRKAVMMSGILGNYTTGLGRDTRGDYIFYSDSRLNPDGTPDIKTGWDINPYSNTVDNDTEETTEKYGQYGQDKKDLSYKIGKALFGNVEDISMGIGTPVPIYDKVYLDDIYNVQGKERGGHYLPEITVTGKKKQGGKMNILEFLKNGSGIHIKEKNKGKFTSYCGGKVTDECILKGKNSSNPAIRKRATFAANARKWKHLDGGIIRKMKTAAGGPIEKIPEVVITPDKNTKILGNNIRGIIKDPVLRNNFYKYILNSDEYRDVPYISDNEKILRFINLYKKSGNPKIHVISPHSRPHYIKGPFINDIYASTSYYDNEKDNANIVAELSHAYQFNNNYAKQLKLKPGIIRGLKQGINRIFNDDEAYEKVGNIEYDAHDIIEPAMREYISGSTDNFEKYLKNFTNEVRSYPEYYSSGVDKFANYYKKGGIIKAEDGTKFNWQSALTNVGTNLFNSYLQSRIQNNKINSEAEAAKAKNDEINLNQYFWDIYLKELDKAKLEEELKNKAISAMNDTVINSSPLVPLKKAYDRASQNYGVLKANLDARNKAIDAQAEAVKSSVITDAVSGVIQNGLGILKDYYGSNNTTNTSTTNTSTTSNSYFDNYFNTKYKKFGTFNSDGSMNMLGGTFTIKDGYKPNQPQLFNYQPPKLNV